VNASGNDEILGHDGGTGGYSSFIGFLRRGGRGVAILSNSTTAVADIGLHLLDPAAPLSAGYNPANSPSLTLRARVHANGERITRGENPVLNGDFSDGDVHWGIDPINWPGPVEHRVQAGALCATLHAGENVRLGWPDSAAAEAGVTGFALARDRQYRLSFRARASGQVRVAASVGHVTPPYTRAVEVVVPLRSSERLFSVDFQSLEADESAGVALRISASSLAQRSELCIDDVALSTLD
jgi:hypothetical protein